MATSGCHGLDLEVRRGEVVGLIGPDGAGKTSTLRVVAGLLRAAAGAVTVLGRDAWRQRRALHHRLGYLAQRFALYGDLSVDENVQFFALLLGVAGWRARRDVLLERVGLAEFRDRLADRLSGGHEAEAGAGVQPDALARGPDARRADHRRRPGDPARVLAAARATWSPRG